jgi:hypothetical protein
MDPLTSAVLFRFDETKAAVSINGSQIAGSLVPSTGSGPAVAAGVSKTGLVPFRKLSQLNSGAASAADGSLPRCRYSLPPASSLPIDGEQGGRKTSDGIGDAWVSPGVSVRPSRHSVTSSKEVIRQARHEAAALSHGAQPPPVPPSKPHRHSQNSLELRDAGDGHSSAVAHACLAKDLGRVQPEVLARRLLCTIEHHEDGSAAGSVNDGTATLTAVVSNNGALHAADVPHGGRRVSSVVRQLVDFDTALLRDAAALSTSGSSIAVSADVLRLGMPLPPSSLPERFHMEKVEPMAICGSTVMGPASDAAHPGATDLQWDPKSKQWKRCVGCCVCALVLAPPLLVVLCCPSLCSVHAARTQHCKPFCAEAAGTGRRWR